MEEWRTESDDKAIERAARLGVQAELGHSALLPLRNGEPWYIGEPWNTGDTEGEKWLAVFSDVSAAEESPVKDFRLVRLLEIFRQQVEGGVGEGIILDPFTYALQVSNGHLKVLMRVAKKDIEEARRKT